MNNSRVSQYPFMQGTGMYSPNQIQPTALTSGPKQWQPNGFPHNAMGQTQYQQAALNQIGPNQTNQRATSSPAKQQSSVPIINFNLNPTMNPQLPSPTSSLRTPTQFQAPAGQSKQGPNAQNGLFNPQSMQDHKSGHISLVTSPVISPKVPNMSNNTSNPIVPQKVPSDNKRVIDVNISITMPPTKLASPHGTERLNKTFNQSQRQDTSFSKEQPQEKKQSILKGAIKIDPAKPKPKDTGKSVKFATQSTMRGSTQRSKDSVLRGSISFRTNDSFRASSGQGVDSEKGSRKPFYTSLARKILESKTQPTNCRRDTLPNMSKPSDDISSLLREGPERKFSSVAEQKRHLENLFDTASILNQEKKLLTELYEQEKLKECTFTPAILEDPTYTREAVRTTDKFCEDQANYRKNVEEKIQHLRDRLGEEDPLFKPYSHVPNINKQSREIVNSKRMSEGKIAVHERLFHEVHQSRKHEGRLTIGPISFREREKGRETVGAKLTEKDGSHSLPEENISFKPEILKKSQNLVRQAKIDDILYNDAKKRIEKSRRLAKAKPSPHVHKVLHSSQKLVSHRLLKDFERAVSEFVKPGENNFLSLVQIAQVLHSMAFMKSTEELATNNHLQEKTLLFDLWVVLKGDDFSGVSKRNLLTFLLAIHGIHVNLPKWEQPPEVQPVAEGQAQDPFFQLCYKLFEERASQIRKPEGVSSPLNGDLHGGLKEPKPEGRATEVRRTYEPDGDLVPSGTVGSYDLLGNFYLNEPEVKKIQKVYDAFYMNRFQATGQANKSKRSMTARRATGTGCTFRPQILETSKQMAMSYREKLREGVIQLFETSKTEESHTDHVVAKDEASSGQEPQKKPEFTHPDLLMLLKKAQKMAHLQAAEEKRNKEMKECPFRPQTLDYYSDQEARTSEAADNRGKNFLSDEGTNFKRTRKMTARSLGKHRAFELYSLAKPSSQRIDRNANEIEYEKYCDECTFTPDISQHCRVSREKFGRGGRRCESEGPRSVDKTVERLRKAREYKEQMEYFKEKGYTLNAAIKIETMKFFKSEQEKSRRKLESVGRKTLTKDSHVSVAMAAKEQGEYDRLMPLKDELQRETKNESHQPYQHKEWQTQQGGGPGNLDGKTGQKVPLLFVDVNLGTERSERIIIFEGDKPDKLAEAFCEKHNLNHDMKARLTDLLEGQFKMLLTRIEEEMPSNSDDEIGSFRLRNQGGHHEQQQQQEGDLVQPTEEEIMRDDERLETQGCEELAGPQE